jgi:hypothetical protein
MRRSSQPNDAQRIVTPRLNSIEAMLTSHRKRHLNSGQHIG